MFYEVAIFYLHSRMEKPLNYSAWYQVIEPPKQDNQVNRKTGQITMLECKSPLRFLFYNLFLSQTASFVDRDMLMRFLGHGIGHINQTKSVVSSNGGNDEGRGADKGPMESCNSCHQAATSLQRVRGAKVLVHTQDSDDNESDSSHEDSSESETESALDDDFDGNL